jgi:Domain of unknown function (DUF5666)
MVRFARFFLLAALTTFAAAQSSAPASNAAPAPVSDPQAAAVVGKLPPLPAGKTTVLGGAIASINPVLDQFTLNIFGGGSMKILFDQRTQVFRNGQRISVMDLRPIDHASIETTLDGSHVYAMRIHLLTHLPQGECRGQVISYDAQSGLLQINAALSPQPVVLSVPAGTPIERVGQSIFQSGGGGVSDLAPGSLVDVKFTANGSGHGVATHIDVLATSGADFLFGGVVTFLDVPSGEMTILDPRDNSRYKVTFDAARFPVIQQLHEGSHVRVSARFDGSHYVATYITPE